MTNATLLAMVRRGARRVAGCSFDADADKRTMLRSLARHGGLQAVVASGREIRELPEHPVLDAVCASPQPLVVLERWMRLERFGHTRNRTRLQGADASRRWAEIVHFVEPTDAESEGDRRPDPIDDLFVWGLLAGLLERAGVEGLCMEIGDDATGRCSVLDGGEGLEEISNPSVVRLRWARASPSEQDRAPSDAGGPAAQASGALGPRLSALFRTDPLHTWTLAESARRLAVSTRQLQRRLRAEDTSFRMALQRVRVDVSRVLLERESVGLAEIAFCAGFSDAAHFSRVFRQHLEVPPSAYRTLVRTEPSAALGGVK